MDSRLIVVLIVIAVVVVAMAYARWHIQINVSVVSASRGMIRFLTDPRTCRVAEQFLVEAAVLWFVFPVLDMIYDHRKISDPLLMQAYIAAVIFFIAAVVLSHVGKGE